MTNLAEEIQSVKDNIAEMISTVQKLDEDTIRWNPTEEEWSIIQIIAHVGEAIPFWLKEIESVQAVPTGKWGRDHFHAGRLMAVSEENITNLTVDQAIADLEKIPSLVEERLSSLTKEQLEIVAPTYNPNFEGKPVEFIVNNLVVKHIEGHLGQINRNLSKLD